MTGDSPQPDQTPAETSPSGWQETEGSDLLAEVVRLDTWHRGKFGRPVSADRLRQELGVGSDRARRLVREIRDHAGANGHHASDADDAHQLQLAAGGDQR